MIVRVQKSLLYKSVLYCRNCPSEWLFDEPEHYLETQMHTQCYGTRRRITSVLSTTPRNSHWSTQNIEFQFLLRTGGKTCFFLPKKKIIKITLGKNEISTKDKNFLKNIGQIIIHENKVQLHFNPNKISTKKVIETLHKSKLDIIDLSTIDVSLEDIFIDMTRENNSKI